MTELDEKDLRIRLPDGAIGRKFDDKATHGLSHCMSAVDFIVEMEEWKKPFVAGCAVMNIKKWNEKFPDFPVIRLSA